MSKTRKHGKQGSGVREVTQERLGSDNSPTQPQPKMPHERDETVGDHSTAGIENKESRDVMRQAHDDVVSGKQDTDRGPVTDATYHKQRS